MFSTLDQYEFPKETVYNAVAEPHAGGPTALVDGVPTSVLFYIGPPSLRSMLDRPTLPAQLRALLDRSEATELAVTLKCHVCADEAPQIKTIRYFAAEHTSTIATFRIIPLLARAADEMQSRLSFSIDNNGIEFDFLNVPVSVTRDRRPETVSQVTYTNWACQLLRDQKRSRNPFGAGRRRTADQLRADRP